MSSCKTPSASAFSFGMILLQILFGVFLFWRVETIDSRVDDLTALLSTQLTDIRSDVGRINSQQKNILNLVEKQLYQTERVLEIIQKPAILNIRTASHDVLINQ